MTCPAQAHQRVPELAGLAPAEDVVPRAEVDLVRALADHGEEVLAHLWLWRFWLWRFCGYKTWLLLFGAPVSLVSWVAPTICGHFQHLDRKVPKAKGHPHAREEASKPGKRVFLCINMVRNSLFKWVEQPSTPKDWPWRAKGCFSLPGNQPR